MILSGCGQEAVHRGQHGPGAGQYLAPRRRQPERPGIAVEKAQPQQRFKRRNPGRDIGLRGVQPFRRAVETGQVGHLHEGFELFDGDLAHARSLSPATLWHKRWSGARTA